MVAFTKNRNAPRIGVRKQKGGHHMDENNATDLMSMTIIANSGDARSFAFQALFSSKIGRAHV